MRIHPMLKLLTLAVLAVCAVAPPVWASFVLPSSLEKMTDGSDAVVIGRVAGQSAYKDGKLVFTGVTIDVEEYLKSDDPAQPPRLAIRVLGGELDGVRYDVAKAPVFEDGEEVLLFLKRTADPDKYSVYGLYYGRYNVTTEADGITRTVSGPLFETEEVYNFSAMKMEANHAGHGAQDLGRFKARVRQLAGQ